jgi:hypothetical protein
MCICLTFLFCTDTTKVWEPALLPTPKNIFRIWMSTRSGSIQRFTCWLCPASSQFKCLISWVNFFNALVVRFAWESESDDRLINLAFSKKLADARKDWLGLFLSLFHIFSRCCSEHVLMSLALFNLLCPVSAAAFEPGTFLDQDVDSVNYSDFVNKELILFSAARFHVLTACMLVCGGRRTCCRMCSNQRAIPSMVDGLKPGQVRCSLLVSLLLHVLTTSCAVSSAQDSVFMFQTQADPRNQGTPISCGRLDTDLANFF